MFQLSLIRNGRVFLELIQTGDISYMNKKKIILVDFVLVDEINLEIFTT